MTISAEHRLCMVRGKRDRFIVFDHGAILGRNMRRPIFWRCPNSASALGLRALDDRPQVCRASTQHGGIAPDEDKRQVVIGVRGLSVAIQWDLAARHLYSMRIFPDFDIHEGEILGLMGSNGWQPTFGSTAMRSCCPVERHGAIEWDESEPRRFDPCRISSQGRHHQLFPIVFGKRHYWDLMGWMTPCDRCDAVLRD